eukprot:11192762-Heterocapsa_arctica.AAC.1
MVEVVQEYGRVSPGIVAVRPSLAYARSAEEGSYWTRPASSHVCPGNQVQSPEVDGGRARSPPAYYSQ